MPYSAGRSALGLVVKVGTDLAAAMAATALAAELPFEGTAKLAGAFTRRGVATVEEATTAA